MFRAAIACIVLAVAVSVASPPAHAGVLTEFQSADAIFSPDGDGKEDTTRFDIRLSAPATAVTLVVFQADSITPVDTLIAGTPLPSGATGVGWNGRYASGALVTEGAYIATITVASSAGPDTTASRQVFVDLSTPSIFIQNVTPNPYAPGAKVSNQALQAPFTVSGTSPALPGWPRDEIHPVVTNASGSTVEADTVYTTPTFAGDDGLYTLVWDASKQTLNDGVFTLTITLLDQAGHVATSSHTFEIDAKPPTVVFTDPSVDARFRTPPPALLGYAYDRSGIDTLRVKYRVSSPYLPITPSSVSGDTAFFAVPLADSLVAQGTYPITIRATDGVSRVQSTTITITIDRTAPSAPTLDPFSGTWHGATFPLAGTIPGDIDVLGHLRIERNGVVADSIFIAGTKKRFEQDVPLVAGVNRLVAVAVDGAGNVGPPSNTVTVTYDTGAGLFAASPFEPGDDFHVNASRDAAGVELRVYDLSGDLVVVLASHRKTRSYVVSWNGHNGDGILCKKGPLVVVASVTYADGGTDTQRALFLFEPNP